MQRQLLKLMLPTEQARTMMFQTAEALRRSNAGEDGAYALVRILTPLIVDSSAQLSQLWK